MLQTFIFLPGKLAIEKIGIYLLRFNKHLLLIRDCIGLLHGLKSPQLSPLSLIFWRRGAGAGVVFLQII